MKSFLQFIIEARETLAASQARKLGLVGDGHGAWLDKDGNYKAKTVKGQLEFLSKKETKKSETSDTRSQKPADIKSKAPVKTKPAPKRLGTLQKSSTKSSTSTSSSQKPSAGGQQVVAPASDGRGNVVTVVFGKFNPPTKTHLAVLTAAKHAAVGGDLFIFPSRTQDKKKNPLDPQIKVDVMRAMFPEYADNIVDDDKFKTIFDVLSFLNQQGYNAVNIICGSERVSEIDSLTAKANGQQYMYNTINVISAGSKDADGENESSSMARKTASEGDFEKFKKTLPKGFDGYAKNLFDELRSSMSVKEMWQIAPDYDWKGLRENYISGKIFNVGDIVESCNTGLRGKIIRSGANHLICVTEDGTMFKSWIKDVCEFNR